MMHVDAEVECDERDVRSVICEAGSPGQLSSDHADASYHAAAIRGGLQHIPCLQHPGRSWM